MEVKNPMVQNKTIGSHTVFVDKNRKIVFIPSKDDDDSGNKRLLLRNVHIYISSYLFDWYEINQSFDG